MNTTDVDIKKILETRKHICVLGLSPDASSSAGLQVVSNLCLLIEYRRHF